MYLYVVRAWSYSYTATNTEKEIKLQSGACSGGYRGFSVQSIKNKSQRACQRARYKESSIRFGLTERLYTIDHARPTDCSAGTADQDPQRFSLHRPTAPGNTAVHKHRITPYTRTERDMRAHESHSGRSWSLLCTHSTCAAAASQHSRLSKVWTSKVDEQLGSRHVSSSGPARTPASRHSRRPRPCSQPQHTLLATSARLVASL